MILREYFILYNQSFYRNHFVYNMALEFIRIKWLRPPEDGANSTETCWGANIIKICAILTCILLDNKDAAYKALYLPVRLL